MSEKITIKDLFDFENLEDLEKAIKKIPVGTAYAVFTGIGAAGTAIIGMIALGEVVNVGKVFFLLLLISGILGLKLIDSSSEEKVSEH